LRLIELSQQQTVAEAMSAHSIRNAGNLASARAEAVQDLLLVSSFGLWAMLLGTAPVVLVRVLTGN
jgi:hypothetical protein